MEAVQTSDNSKPFSPAALRKLRLARGWPQRQVATKMGWNSVNSYGQMELGVRRRATIQTLKRLAKVFQCRVTDEDWKLLGIPPLLQPAA